jgi:hypothetical protein
VQCSADWRLIKLLSHHDARRIFYDFTISAIAVLK